MYTRNTGYNTICCFLSFYFRNVSGRSRRNFMRRKKKKKNFVFPEKSNLEKCFLIEIWITFFHVRLTGNSNSNNLLIVYVKVPPHTQTNICRSVSVSFFIVHYQTNNLNINLKIKFKALSFKTFEEANKNEFDKNLIFHFVRVWRLSYLRHQGYTGY